MDAKYLIRPYQPVIRYGDLPMPDMARLLSHLQPSLRRRRGRLGPFGPAHQPPIHNMELAMPQPAHHGPKPQRQCQQATAGYSPQPASRGGLAQIVTNPKPGLANRAKPHDSEQNMTLPPNGGPLRRRGQSTNGCRHRNIRNRIRKIENHAIRPNQRNAGSTRPTRPIRPKPLNRAFCASLMGTKLSQA
jgi:hypothetical protein